MLDNLVKEKTTRQEISVRLYPNKELRDFFKLLIDQMEVSDKGTGKMTINFSQFSPVSIDWRDA
jgi:hypothetical protein